MTDSLLRLVALIKKELLAIFKDPRTRFAVFVPPVIQVLIFGYVASFDLTEVRYAVVDRDRSAVSRALLADLDGSGLFRRVADLHTDRDVAALLETREVLLVVQLAPDLERRLHAGDVAAIQVIADGRNSNTAATALGYVNAVVARFTDTYRRERGHPSLTPARLESRAWFNPNLESRWFMVPGLLGTLSLIEVVILTAMSVAREREMGTFDQLLVTPFTPVELMIGKALPNVFIGLCQVTLVLAVAIGWFRLPFQGSFTLLYAALTLFLVSAVGIGLLVSSLVSTMQQAFLGAFMIIMPATLLSGLTAPVSNMPAPVRALTAVNPLRYAIEIVHRVFLEGAGLEHVWPLLWPLVIIAALSLGLATWAFRRGLA